MPTKQATFLSSDPISKARPPRKKLSSLKMEREAMLVMAREYCLRTYAVAYTAGEPRLLQLPCGEVWIFPVVMTSPGFGRVGEVGVLAFDRVTGKLLDATPRSEGLS